MNLPNSITLGRILVTPLVAWLPFVPDWRIRLLGWVLFLAAAITDYVDGNLARSRGLITDLGKLLDPLADKLLLLGTFVPMYLLQAPPGSPLAHMLTAPEGVPEARGFPFVLPGGSFVYLPLVLPAVVIARELLMTVFRQTAARRGVVIAAIGPAKWKTGFQQTWVGAAYAWFSLATLATSRAWWDEPSWRAMAYFCGIVGTVSMIGAVALTLWSLWLYVRRYGMVLVGGAPRP